MDIKNINPLPIGVRETVRLDHPDLFGHLFLRLSQGSRVELLHRGQPGLGPIRHETLGQLGASLLVRPAEPDEGGWGISNNRTLSGWVDHWQELVKDEEGQWKRGPRGGLSYYLSVRRTEKAPLLRHRR